MSPKTADFLIVGAGSAGCVLANRLSENPANRVVLLEAGGRDLNPWIHVPVGYFKTLHNPNTDWRYKSEPDAGLNGRSLDWPRGKTLGGSSSINGLLYVRGQKEDYDRWAQMGNRGWSYDDVLPLFKRSEAHENGADTYHGGDGGLSVSLIRAKSEISEAFIDAAVEMGVPRTEDYNGENQEGAGYFHQTAKGGFRCSSARAFLNPAKKRPNLQVITHAHTEKLIFDINDARRVVGVRYSKNGQTHEVRLNPGGEVVLSAGAIGSPQILELSGIGRGDVLQNAGVAVRHELPGVGENLQDHLQIRLVYEVNAQTLNDAINRFIPRMGIGLNYVLFRKGPMSLGASQVCVFAKSMQGLETPDIQFHFQPLSADKPGIEMHPFSGITSSVCQLRPESRGHIHISSPKASDYPKIVPNYLSATADQLCAVRAVKFARAMTKTQALSPFIVREHVPDGNPQTDEELLDCARNISQTIYHPTSTCRMGNDDLAVVDDRLRVRGIDGLRIADASIMPDIVSGNTNAPTIMIGEKASDMILQDRAARA
ncbi:GMC family oxidoreductase N-terminal domain-containing protein [Shimia sp. CNT1-13L.2]|uniref:GMC family oxidoreductase n=1 Tax=Shimia sp. CNT1-13L.2 TaxID=2959663 RepID=UPI0020CF4338|nr:GMC family oxidoreductase N-terminal domain-containing protein [Shimia sp. CNT1-13L.2]MCP9483872.1 GMC family oxidoreductase N-terminal domain-containing protein [Shimia sp. CNT1-13L.2]